MSRSVENILLQVNHVKHKKYEGTLYLMGERLAWMASHKNDTFSGMYFFPFQNHFQNYIKFFRYTFFRISSFKRHFIAIPLVRFLKTLFRYIACKLCTITNLFCKITSLTNFSIMYVGDTIKDMLLFVTLQPFLRSQFPKWKISI